MKLALAQINPTVGDFAGNAARIIDQLDRARSRGADLVVFSEMALPGFPALDLIRSDSFVAECARHLDSIARRTEGLAALIGHVTHRDGGRPLNAAALVAGGEVVERRARLVEVGGKRLQVLIGGAVGHAPVDPGAELLIHLAADPFCLGERGEHRRRLAELAEGAGRPLVSVNQVGGNESLVFAGSSLALSAEGRLIARGKELDEDQVIVDLHTGEGELRAPLPGDTAAAVEALTVGTRDYASKSGFRRAVLGLSGGIDSALVAAIAARALGPENVMGVSLPSPYSSQGSLDDAAALAANLGIEHRVIPIGRLFQSFLDELAPAFEGLERDVTEENIQARVRGVLLMALSNKLGSLLLSTGNKSEAYAGYATLYGDMTGGLAVICDLPKTLVYQVCEELNRDGELIPRAIIDKAPSAELRPGQKDEDSLPPYAELDPILELLVDRKMDAGEVVAAGHETKTVKEVARLVRTSEYKRRQAPPGLFITSDARGRARHMPLAHGWKN